MKHEIEKNALVSQFKDLNATERAAFFLIQIWRIKDVASVLDCSVGHIYNLCSQKMIPFHKKGKRGRLYFIPSEILDWIKDGGFR